MELTVRRGIPVTTPLRTLADLRPHFAPRAFERAIDEAERLKLAPAQELHALLPSHAPGSTLTGATSKNAF